MMLSLEGIKVVDFTQAAAGPFGAMLLGDMGADVIKIEPLTGDHFRAIFNGIWASSINRNKRGIAVDLRSTEGKEIAKKLIAEADVMLEAFVPGVMDKLGLGYEEVKKINPGIIYCSISGYGQDGPYSKRPGYDICAQCESGLLAATGEEGRPPVRVGSSLIDYGTGLYAAFAIMVALRHRDKTGQGQQIDTSLLDTGVSFMNYWVTLYSVTGENPKRVGSGHAMAAPYQIFDSKDLPVFIGITGDKNFKEFCNAFKCEELASDPRFATNDERCKNRDVLVPLVQNSIKQHTRQEILEKMAVAGIPSAPVLTVGEMMEDPHVKARNMIVDVDFPGTGKIKIPNIPFRMSETPGAIRRTMPALGEHTLEILREVGYTEEQTKKLIEGKVVLQQGQ
jgi:crotonobetainyl-CoA:carnitine CoA-transferase CaiB-like acyl-CoA transferase